MTDTTKRGHHVATVGRERRAGGSRRTRRTSVPRSSRSDRIQRRQRAIGITLRSGQQREVALETRDVVGIRAVIVAADAELRVDEREAVAVRDRLGRPFALARRQLGDAQRTIAYQTLDLVAVARHEEPAGRSAPSRPA